MIFHLLFCGGFLFLSTLPARGATGWSFASPCRATFLSTLPARGATAHPGRRAQGGPISIHAPREGSDRSTRQTSLQARVFLSTLPARGATQFLVLFAVDNKISIHAPREGSDEKP